jgi:hypothetical protein
MIGADAAAAAGSVGGTISIPWTPPATATATADIVKHPSPQESGRSSAPLLPSAPPSPSTQLGRGVLVSGVECTLCRRDRDLAFVRTRSCGHEFCIDCAIRMSGIC